jgi:hypothetical protein
MGLKYRLWISSLLTLLVVFWYARGVCVCNLVHDITTLKRVMSIVTTVKTSNLLFFVVTSLYPYTNISGLTTFSTAILKKLTFVQLQKKFPFEKGNQIRALDPSSVFRKNESYRYKYRTYWVIQASTYVLNSVRYFIRQERSKLYDRGQC